MHAPLPIAVDGLALTAIVAPQVVALGLVIVSVYWHSRLSETSREHEVEMARLVKERERELAEDAHVRSRREAVYVDLLTMLRRYHSVVEGVEPAVAPAADPRAVPSDEEIWELDARVRAFGSDEVNALFARWEELRERFWFAVSSAQLLRSEDARGERHGEVGRTGRDATSAPSRDIDDLRGDLHEQEDRIRGRVALELRGATTGSPPPPPPPRVEVAWEE